MWPWLVVEVATAVEDSTIEVDSVVEDEDMAAVEEVLVGRGECLPGKQAATDATAGCASAVLWVWVGASPLRTI